MLIRTRLRGQPPLSTVLRIASREGCDLGPLDPGDDQDRLTLTSYVWADQIERLARLRAACDLAPAVSAPVQRAAAGEWVEAQLGEPAPDAVTVVFHSIVMQYLSDAERQRLEEALQAERPAGLAANGARRRPNRAAPDPMPGGDEQLLARAGYHGDPLDWIGP